MDQLLKQILEVQSHSGKVKKMNKTIMSIAETFGCTIKVKDKSIYVTKGEPTEAGYPCMVSHTDTVHKIVPDNEYSVIHDTKHDVIYGYNPVKHEFTGIGGDDKVGIYITLYCLRELPSFKAVFFRDEEIGCVGSNNADMKFFTDCMYILQCDRRNKSDFITKIGGTELSSSTFQQDILDIISDRGYKFQDGMTTDVGALAKKDVGVSVANMSCGYYNPHSDDEIIDIKDMNNCRDMCMEIFTTLTSAYPFIAPKYVAPVYTYPAKDYSYSGQGNLYTNYNRMSNEEWEDLLNKRYPKQEDEGVIDTTIANEANRYKWLNDIDDHITDDMIDTHALIIAYGWDYCKKGFYKRSSYGGIIMLPHNKFNFIQMYNAASNRVLAKYNQMTEDWFSLVIQKEEESVSLNHLPIDAIEEYACCDGCGKTMIASEIDKQFHCCTDCVDTFGFKKQVEDRII